MKTRTDRLPQIPFRYDALPPDGPWMTQEEAAAYLGVGPYHLNSLIGNTHRIEIVRTTTDRKFACTRASVEAEKEWRDTAKVRRKALRLIGDWFKQF
ncbi:hypothetical protein ABT247_06585 [Kitasatospora sp. NPDC001539]|uniref:hypothetical protein n=1 Tax=Kitasatospora sp. NPDC001539 TaxID=3154384 RepID=UPI00332145B7